MRYGLNELREMFLKFFEERGHLRLDSFSLVPEGDKSLLLINSGMAPMKMWFTGETEPPRGRVCSCQKCVRTGDIENVGKTSRHGTFFEMLGNFSFGDYFKIEAIRWCWEFLTECVGLDSVLLYPSVYEEDDEAYGIWVNEIGVPLERVVRLGKSDNFWEHGQGPCGPCSEVYFDRGADAGCGEADCGPGCDCDRFVEVWNNVFTQYMNDGTGNYSELRQKNIDTGMGLERLAVVVQGVDSLFDVDTIKNVIDEVSRVTGVCYGESERGDVSIRIITDHVRAGVMLVCDGVMPSNEGRGYVLRRLIRRAARHGRLLGASGAILEDIAGRVIDINTGAYPELEERREYIVRVIRVEEENFARTIDSGSAMLKGLIDECLNRGERELPGADVFRLYDTYGFPYDLTVEILSEHGLVADTFEFERLMELQRERARTARGALDGFAWSAEEIFGQMRASLFTGYSDFVGNSYVEGLLFDGSEVGELCAGDEGVVVLAHTPFYAEMGGQVCDLGVITNGENLFEVHKVRMNKGGVYLHYGIVRSGSFRVGEHVRTALDTAHRVSVMRAHTATHLLHSGLRSVLGPHVYQAGSLVSPDEIRFDFTHNMPLNASELESVERFVNDAVLSGYTVKTLETTAVAAREVGAMALFGEKYGDIVRVVQMGDVSVELCGGTHLENTGRVGAFRILREFSVASGVRRIEAVVGRLSLRLMDENRRVLEVACGLLKTSKYEEIPERLEQRIRLERELRAKIDSLAERNSGDYVRELLGGGTEVSGLVIVCSEVMADGVSGLRKLGDKLREIEPCSVSLLVLTGEDKSSILVSCGSGAVSLGLAAGVLVREVCLLCDGSGGGRAESAMGGARDVTKIREVFDKFPEIVRRFIKK